MTTKIMDCDLVVIGGGTAGMVAAVKAADVSGKKVIVLEKAKKVGGASIFAHGISIRDSKWQKKAGEAVNDPPDITGQFFDWLVTKGGAEEYWRIAKPGETRVSMSSLIMDRRMDKYKGHPDPVIGPGWVGSYVVEKMVECCEKMKIPILTETPAREFITDSNGKVTGVLADTKDGQLLVNCKACFIGAGGFGADYEKCRKIWPGEFNYKPMLCLAPPTLAGDWIEMAEGIGVSVDLGPAWVSVMGVTHHPYTHSIFMMLGQPEMVQINLNGERWNNEGPSRGGGRPGFDRTSVTPLAKQPGGGMFAIADQPITEMAAARAIANPNEDLDVPILKRWKEEIAFEVEMDEKGAHGHHTKKADTFAELALKMNIDPRKFVATMERYNKFCENGKDLDFGKDAEYLIPIKTPPFYAFYGHRFSQCTHGGIAVNDNCEVLDTKGNVMPGLYAGGDCTTIYSSGNNTSAAKWSGGGPFGAPGVFGSGEGSPGGGLPGGIGSGYAGGINAGNYLKNL